MPHYAPKTGFGDKAHVTLSTRACRRVLEELGMTEEMFFDFYQRAVASFRATSMSSRAELVQTLAERDAEIERLRKELEAAQAVEAVRARTGKR